jgi:DNA-binding winged helix-turn-helix (wHTH) protein/Tol biopolymer transport system component
LQPEDSSETLRTSSEEEIVLFGSFALNLHTGELTKDGIKIRLQNKPFQLLKALIEHPGRVITREELKARLWPENTFVDFESGLNTAANRLRLALCDSAEDPRYIETLPRIGYRFIAGLKSRPDTSSGVAMVLQPQLARQPSSSAGPALVRSALRLPFSAQSFGFRAGVVTVFAACVGTAILWPHIAGLRTSPVFHQLTFSQGTVSNARFTGTGEVIYAATWKDQPENIYLMDVARPESRRLGFGDASLGAVSRSSDLAILRKMNSAGDWELDVSALQGGVPRPVDKNIVAVDWAPDGFTLCLVRKRDRDVALEYPAGKVIYTTAGWFGQPRLSLDGNLVAVVEHPLREDDGGWLLLVSRDGQVQRLTDNWASIGGLAWRPTGAEIWFAAAKQGLNREIYATRPDKRTRRVASMPAALDMFDISKSGRVLMGRSISRLSMYIGNVDNPTPKNVSWLDWSRAVALSADGNTLLFDESGEGGGPLYTVYLHHRKEGTTQRIANGRAMDLSPDGNWVLTGGHSADSELKLISVVTSQVKKLCAPHLIYQSARFLPNSRAILVQANEQGKPIELYLQDIDSGKIQKIPGGRELNHPVPSPDGKRLAGYIAPDRLQILELSTGTKSLIALPDPALPVAWIGPHELVVTLLLNKVTTLQRLDILTHSMQPMRQIPGMPTDPLCRPPEIIFSNDLKTFAYSHLETSTGLFAVDGWS